MTMIKKMNMESVRDYIKNSSKESVVYIGGDSSRFRKDGQWYADYNIVVVIHINGKNGCKIFGETTRELDFDQKKNRPAMRLMNEVFKVSGKFLELSDILQDRKVEIHLDLNKDKIHGSSCVIDQAIGYIKGTCNITPKVKPEAWSASYAADRYDELDSLPKAA